MKSSRCCIFLSIAWVTVACSQKDRALDSASEKVMACAVLPGPDADPASVTVSTLADDRATCDECGECGTELADDDAPSFEPSAALDVAALHPLEVTSVGWTTRFHGKAHGWSAVFPEFADTELEWFVGKLAQKCEAIGNEDANNLKRCVLLKFVSTSTGFYPYTSRWQKVRCECNQNVNAVHPDE